MKSSPENTDEDEAGKPGRVWVLPAGPSCASRARGLLGEALREMGVPRDLVGDAQLMISELATNAYQHAAEHGPHELWLYLDDPEEGPVELRCAVFDRDADADLPGYSWTSGDCGRGLSIVRELSEGHWGLARTHSRTSLPTRGKAVWFVLQGVDTLAIAQLRASAGAVGRAVAS
ncbi:ATP-binding protein [Spirillospora sp. CA-294931]|uniref:ATP-binding protein n=1 Tax=Spirillospora sp. CA-294931 TaxID=3240042 RepID=UPI003D8EB18E